MVKCETSSTTTPPQKSHYMHCRLVRSLSARLVLLNTGSPLRLTAAIPSEISHFNALASSWWDTEGPQRILHKMNLLRMDFISSNVSNHVKLNPAEYPEEEEVYIPPYNIELLPSPIRSRIIEDLDTRRTEIMRHNKLSVLDVGCGGGILSEAMARLDFVSSVRGIDLSRDVLNAALIHREKDPLFNDGRLQYDLTAIEDLSKDTQYDIVTMFEMLEHVEFPGKVLREGLDRVKEGGWLFLSTINRDPVSWFTTIFMGEHVLNIVPPGTHLLSKYINHDEIVDWISHTDGVKDEFEVVDSKGCMYLPACGWVYTPLPKVGNYFLALRRKPKN